MRFRRHTGAAAAALLMICATGWAQTSLPLTDDATLNGIKPDTNFGAAENIAVHTYGPKYGLVRFDSATIAGQTVNSGTLTLFLNAIKSPGSVDIYAVTTSWNESGVTWNSQPATEATAAATIDLAPADAGSVVSVDVTQVVQRWADGSLADAGFLIVTDSSIKAKFDTKEKPGGTPAALNVDSGPAPYTGEAIVLDLSKPENCSIDEPGYYVLDRNWRRGPPRDGYAEAACVIGIASEGVTLDMKGFAFDGYTGNPLYINTEARVTLRDGTLDSEEFVAIDDRPGTGGTVILDRIRAAGDVDLGGRRVVVTGGAFAPATRGVLTVGEGSHVTGAEFSCSGGYACIVAGGASLIRDCSFRSSGPNPVISSGGEGTIIKGNIVEGWIAISGNGNVIARNLSRSISSGGYILVIGTGNILDGNIGLSIDFESPGNFYGNNRVALPGGFSGTDGNVDWGGNVTY